MLKEISLLILVAVLWGSTNPLIKKGTSTVKIVNVTHQSRFKRLLHEWQILLLNFSFIIPFGLNQLGSILYFFALQNVDISIAVPVTNSLTFIFTAITGIILGERKPRKKTYIGILLILFGTCIICYDRYKMDIKH
ncbi:putative transmembrane family 234 [Popillia japonica]|uniref:Transmembrane family 234 n=1 Tax=Popillia japonica TaxID=7064 RepID=A0AAW1L5U8_POPJA